MKKIVYLFLAYTFFLSNTYSQNFSDDPSAFIVQLKQTFAGSKNDNIISLGNQLETVFNNGSLSDAQKKSVVKQFQNLQKKKFKISPHFANLSGIVAFSVTKQNLSGKKLDSLFILNHKVIDSYSIKMTENYLASMKTFMEYRAFYYGNYNYTKLVGGDISFQFVEGATEKDVIEVKETVETNTKNDANDWFTNWDDNTTNNQQVDVDLQPNYDPAEDWAPKLPNIVGCIIKINNGNLVLGTKNDSITVTSTSGIFLIESKKYVGDKGLTDWKSAGINDIKVEFGKFVMETNKPQLEALNVKLNYLSKVEKELKGNYFYKAEKKRDTLGGSYPRFVSFESNVKVKNIGQNLTYTGGFTLNGRKIYSNSLDGKKSKIELIEGGVKKFVASSYRFELLDHEILSPLAAVVIIYGKDSVSHPGVSFIFDKRDSRLVLMNQNSSFKNTPFLDTYHKMEMLAEMVIWKTNTKKIDFTMLTGRSETPLKFTSVDYFDEKFFDKMKGLYTFHPLQLAINYTRELKRNEFYTDEMSKKYKLNPVTLNTAMKDLGKQGYLDYQEGGKCKILTKGYHYSISKEGKKDYDQINILSKETKNANGTLDMEANELIIRGVEQFPLSEKLNVYLKPKDKEIKILKDRDFKFDGILVACDMLIFHGKNFRFDYDSFFVDLKYVDSLKLRIKTKEKDKDGKFIVKDLKSQLESSAGILYINKTFNKSAKKVFPEYPIYKSYKGSFIYYDSPKILNGVYGKQIYFEIPPFTIDSLTSFSEPVFDGTFRSGGIIPDIKERITVMPEDLSLGFEHKLPEAGYPLYKGKGKFFKRIKVSNNGMRGDGYMEYLTGTYRSEDFVFYPDSLITIGTMAEIKDGKIGKAFYADAVIGQYDMKWFHKQDSMTVSNYADPFQMYKGTTQFSGKAIISPKGMHGEGTVETRGSESSSRNITFGQQDYNARDAYFRVLSQDPKKPAVEAKNVKLEFDFKSNHCYFSPEILGTAANEFPYLQYKTSMEGGDWDLTKKIITFKRDEKKPIHTSYFVSVHPEQDSLLFYSTQAVYDIEKQILNVDGVPFIFVGDSKIMPEKKKVVIRENADMELLENAKLQIDSTNKRFNLYKGQIKVFSKNEFKGEALYDYYNSDSVKFTLKFSEFEFKDPNLIGKEEENLSKKDLKKSTKTKNPKFKTTAFCEILEKDTFRIAPKIIYRGKCRIRADKPALVFDGEAKLDLKAYKGNEQWLKFVNDGSTDNVDIDIKNAKAEDGSLLTTGLYLDLGTYKMYSTFLSKLKANDDKVILKASDNFVFDNQKAVFRIGDLDKLNKKKLEGNVFSYNDKNSHVYYTGKINTFDNFKDFEILTSVVGEGRADSALFSFDFFLGVKMNIPAPALDQMAKNIKTIAYSFEAPRLNLDKDTTAMKLADFAGNKSGEDMKKWSALDFKPISDFSKSLANYVAFPSVKAEWSQKYSSFYSKGKLNLGNVLKTDISYLIDGNIEIKKTPNGDLFFMYLEPAPGHWYFFSFEQNKLAVISSDEIFNKAVSSKSKGELTKGRYYFILADELEKDLFLRDFYKNFLGKEYEMPQKQEIPTKEEEGEGGF